MSPAFSAFDGINMNNQIMTDIKIGNKYIKEQINSISDSLDSMNAISHDHDIQLAKYNLEIKDLNKKIADMHSLLEKKGLNAFFKHNWWKIGGFILTWLIIVEKVHS